MRPGEFSEYSKYAGLKRLVKKLVSRNPKKAIAKAKTNRDIGKALKERAWDPKNRLTEPFDE